MILRLLFVLQLALCHQILQAQILEELSVDHLGRHMDSLISKGEIIKAYDEFYIYTNFLPNHNQIMGDNEALLEVQKRVENAKLGLSGKSDEQLFEYYRIYLNELIKTRNFQKASLILNRFNKIKEANVLLDSVTRILPTDTIHVYQQNFPVQLFSVPQRELYDYNNDLITDDFTIYRKLDSSLFKGIIISRNNTTESMMNEYAHLAYDNYVNGQRIERISMSFGRAQNLQNDLYSNDLFFGYDSNHYILYHKVITNRTDTIRSFTYQNNNQLIKEETAVKTKNNGVQSVFFAEYNSDGSIKKWQELAPVSERHKHYDSYSCWVNQFGDTLSEEFVLVKDELTIVQERILNPQGDTISLSRTINSILDGLQIENRHDDDGLNFELRSIFDDGTVVDILSDSVLYFNEDWDIISKEEYILLMNQGDDDFPYFYSGIFKEYFPDADFKAYPYFISASGIGLKNYKQFTKAVKKYFKVKI